MSKLIDAYTALTLMFIWFAGVYFAQGFWQTSLSLIVPPYAGYLVVQHILDASCL